MKIVRLLIMTALISGLSSSLFAAEYYIAPSGSNSNPGTSQAYPFATFAYAFSKMAGGDTLWVKDGEYFEPIGQYGVAKIPSGNPEKYTEIKAVNDHKVTINMTGKPYPAIRVFQDEYIKLRGFRCFGTTAAYTSVVDILGNHIELKCIGAWDIFGTQASGYAGTVIAIGSNDVPGYYARDVLLEDCWSFGKGRYSIQAYKSHDITFRRCVARPDRYAYAPGFPVAGMNIGYNCRDILAENCIVLDVAAFTGQEAYSVSNFYFNTSPAADWGNDNMRMYGNIALNMMSIGGEFLLGEGFRFEKGSSYDSHNCVFKDNVFWDTGWAGMWIGGGKAWNWQISNTTIGKINNITFMNPGIKTAYNGVDNLSIKNCLFTDFFDVSNGYAIYINGGTASASYNAENNTKGFYGVQCGIGCQQDQNPKMKHIVRVEADSPLHVAGEGGANIGATVLKRYVNGVLTDENLWPWPYEDFIKEDMRLSAQDGKRGFCADGKQLNGVNDITLTSYIWEYLGNPIPPEIYGSSGIAGDLNSDGKVDVADVQACVSHILGVQDYGTKADANADGVVNILDVQLIVNAILGS